MSNISTLNDPECYIKIYGDLIQYVPHYMIQKLDLNPGALNYIPQWKMKYFKIPEEIYGSK